MWCEWRRGNAPAPQIVQGSIGRCVLGGKEERRGWITSEGGYGCVSIPSLGAGEGFFQALRLKLVIVRESVDAEICIEKRRMSVFIAKALEP